MSVTAYAEIVIMCIGGLTTLTEGCSMNFGLAINVVI